MFKSITSNDNYSKDIMSVLMYMYGFKNIANIPTSTYLSGSSVLKMIQKKRPEEFNDLDLYIQNGVNSLECDAFIKELTTAGYLKGKSDKSIDNIKKSLMNECGGEEYTIKQGHAYFSLKEYIDKIVSLKSGSNSVDIIIINKSIEELLENTFDMDIVKNYVKVRDDKLCIYSSNIEAINEKKATISNKHFENRIMHNAYEFNNFVKRYVKYSKHYDIWIGDCILSIDKFTTIIEYIFEDIQKNSKRVEYSKGDISAGFIANVKIDDTVYKVGSFNETGTRLLFAHLLNIFKSEKRLNDLKKFISNVMNPPMKTCVIQ